MQVMRILEERVSRSEDGPWGEPHFACGYVESYHSSMTEEWCKPFATGNSSGPSVWCQRRVVRLVREDDAKQAVQDALKAVAEMELMRY